MKQITKPYPYQKQCTAEAIDFLDRFGGALISCEMGLGKSLIALMIVSWLKLKHVLIICPAGLKYNWQNECQKHFNLACDILEGQKPYQGALQPRSPVTIINYDILKYWLLYLQKCKFDLVIMDECHYASNRRAQRSRACKAICKTIKKRLGLSGTPFVNRPSELWHILHLLQPQRYKFFRPWAEIYCAPHFDRFGWHYDGAENLDVLHRQLIKRVMVRRLKSEVLKDLPPKQHIVVPLELSNRREYERALSEFWREARLAGDDDPLRKEQLKRQFTSNVLRLVALLKLKSVFEWLDNYLVDTNDKIAVFGIHKKIIKALMKRYKGRCLKIDGSIDPKLRPGIVETFAAKKRYRLLFCNIKAGGVGLNFKGVSDVAVVELWWNPGTHNQAFDRAHGKGRGIEGRQTRCFWLIAHKTAEERLCKLLQERQQHADTVFDGKKSSTELRIFNDLMSILRRER